jgi:penicillin amidase
MWDEWTPYADLLPVPSRFQTLNFMKQHGDHALMDIDSTRETETLADLLLLSLNKMVQQVKEMKLNWSAFKAAYIRHLLRIEPFGRYQLTTGGNSGIVNAMAESHGPSWRMVVVPGGESFGVYPGGQSGNPGSAHYDDFLKTWEAGEYYPLQLLPADIEPDGFRVQTLLPQ